jgi:cytoskeleton protein RodZ
MAERKDKEPVFGKLDDLDETDGLPSELRGLGLRSDGNRDRRGAASASRDSTGDTSLGVSDPEPAISVASGLTMRTHPVEPAPDGSGPGQPGAGIRFAREKLGMDKSDLASRTRLSRRIIEDLEGNRFDSMPPAYVRGYLRGVARELGGDAENWIRAYEGLGYTEPVLRPTVQRNPSARWGLSGGVWSLTVAAILVSALGLGVYAWTEGDRETPFAGIALWLGEVQQRFTRAAPEPVPEVEPGPDATMPVTPGEPVTELEWAQEVSPPEPAQDPLIMEPLDAPEAAPPTEPESVAPPAEEGLPAVLPESRAGVDDAVQTEPPVVLEPDPFPARALPGPVSVPQPDPVEGEAPAVATEREMSPAVVPAPAPAARAGQDTSPAVVPAPAARDGQEAAPVAEVRSVLSLSFDATSWVEVRSASDRVALQGIFHAGDERTVSVQLPARVVLGNAPAVRLVRDGAAVDLTPHSRTDRTARFSLGAD